MCLCVYYDPDTQNEEDASPGLEMLLVSPRDLVDDANV